MLTPDQKLDVAIQVLEVVAEFVASDKVEFKGSVQFKPAMVNAVFTDKTLNFMLDGGEDKEFGRSMAAISALLDREAVPWYEIELPAGYPARGLRRVTSRSALSKFMTDIAKKKKLKGKGKRGA